MISYLYWYVPLLPLHYLATQGVAILLHGVLYKWKSLWTLSWTLTSASREGSLTPCRMMRGVTCSPRRPTLDPLAHSRHRRYHHPLVVGMAAQRNVPMTSLKAERRTKSGNENEIRKQVVVVNHHHRRHHGGLWRLRECFKIGFIPQTRVQNGLGGWNWRHLFFRSKTQHAPTGYPWTTPQHRQQKRIDVVLIVVLQRWIIVWKWTEKQCRGRFSPLGNCEIWGVLQVLWHESTNRREYLGRHHISSVPYTARIRWYRPIQSHKVFWQVAMNCHRWNLWFGESFHKRRLGYWNRSWMMSFASPPYWPIVFHRLRNGRKSEIKSRYFIATSGSQQCGWLLPAMHSTFEYITCNSSSCCLPVKRRGKRASFLTHPITLDWHA